MLLPNTSPVQINTCQAVGGKNRRDPDGTPRDTADSIGHSDTSLFVNSQSLRATQYS